MSDAEVYKKYADELVRYANALVGPSQAEDVLAAAVLNAFAATGWAAVDNKRAYLYRCVSAEAARVARTAERRMRREIRAASRSEAVDQPVDRDVRLALLALSERQRSVVYLVYWRDLTPGDAAVLLGVSQRTVERELTKARRRLEGLLR